MAALAHVPQSVSDCRVKEVKVFYPEVAKTAEPIAPARERAPTVLSQAALIRA